ncbi:MAG: hypothetical protein HYY15_00110 [Candidatus Omnitrophica bacterium]|nr:hypothetical protein [Candidatus Omnitrophota bacterium]
MKRPIPGWLIPVVFLAAAGYAIAEDLTLTTYYPSPRGVYQELRTSGNVAIGTTTPPTVPAGMPPRLYVLGTGINTTLRIDNADSGVINPFVINSDGTVGVGTTDPAGYMLNVNGTTRVTGFQMPTGAAAGRVLTATNVQGVAEWQSSSGAAPGTIVAWARVAGANAWTCYEGAGCAGFNGPCVSAAKLWDPQNVMTLDVPASQSATYFAVSGCSSAGPQVYKSGSCALGYQYITIPGQASNPSQGEYGSTYYVCVKQ